MQEIELENNNEGEQHSKEGKWKYDEKVRRFFFKSDTLITTNN